MSCSDDCRTFWFEIEFLFRFTDLFCSSPEFSDNDLLHIRLWVWNTLIPATSSLYFKTISSWWTQDDDNFRPSWCADGISVIIVSNWFDVKHFLILLTVNLQMWISAIRNIKKTAIETPTVYGRVWVDKSWLSCDILSDRCQM